MPRVPPRLWRSMCSAAALAVCAATVGCGAPPDLRPADGVTVPAIRPTSTPATASPSPIAQTVPPGTPALPSPSPTGFAESFAVSCAGRPGATQVIRLLRRNVRLLPAGAQVSVDTGPLCAGTWQYTVLVVPGREPLAVVTEGRPGALRLVTAGTNVCSIPVRTQAPIGIRTAAACS